ncbi:MAG: PQQ-like beta-propeller repeat protein [Candidatus Bathyarchaeota archaeon]|nr:PQQ-like beta-propeller repeat protein [Candidatus Bathyarchaeota archaeon]
MQIPKKTTTAIALFLVLTFALSLVGLPAVTAHDPPWMIKTYAFIDVNPDPIGVGQEAFVTFGIDKVPMTVSAQYGDRWTNLTVEITYPDGSKKTLSGFTADDTGFAHTTFTPEKTGNYTFVCKFGGQTLVGANPPPGGFSSSAREWIGDVYLPSESSPSVLTVQDEPVGMIPFGPLPTDYWQRPINMMNSNWNTISGNWLGLMNYVNAGLGYNVTTNFHPYVELGNTAHVLWTTPMAPGGLIGGEYGDTAHSNFYSTAQYECKFLPVILNGVLYFTLTPGASTNKQGTVAFDIRTGKELWHSYSMNGTLRCGQIYNYISPNQYGGLAYLWTTSGNTYSMYDAMTGNWILDIQNGTTSVQLVSQPESWGPAAGSLLAYYINTTGTPRLVLWNSSRCILRGVSGTSDPNSWSWRPTQGGKFNWQYGIEWEAPIATNITSGGVTSPISLSMSGGQSSGNIGITGDAIILAQQPTGNWQNWQIEAGYSIRDGRLLWGPINRTNAEWTRVVTYSIGDGIYISMNNEMQTIDGYDAMTGKNLWTAKFPTNTIWGYFSAYRPVSGYGLMFDSTFDGHCYAWNMTTGKLEWDWWAGPADYNTVYGSWPVKVIELVADGKVYLSAGHTYNPPLFRGGHFYCLNATTGELIWQMLGFCQSNSPVVAAADGTLFLPNAYDNLLYAFGKGRSATTIEAPSAAIPFGSSLVIRGTVTDQSPGQTCLGIPAAGTPAIADECMGAWMEYLYEQQPKPTNATGVPVSIDVLDSNGNYRNIGTVTSDANGFYSFEWKPDIPGKFTVYAKFAGSESYYGSSAETAFVVEEAPAATPGPTPEPASLADLYFLPMSIGTIIAIVVVIALLALLLRKRP